MVGASLSSFRAPPGSWCNPYGSAFPALNDGAFDAAMAMFSRVWGFPRPCRPTLPREHVPNPATVTLLGQSVPDRLEDRVDPHAKLNKQGDACLDLNRGRYRC